MDDKAKQEYIDFAVETLLKGGTLKEIRGISNDELEAVYTVAYNFYRAGQYKEADTLFCFLTQFDHLNPKFWIGLGAVRQAKKEFEAAFDAYSYAAFLNARDPKPQYYAAVCLLALGEKEKAATVLSTMEQVCEKDSENARKYFAKAKELPL